MILRKAAFLLFLLVMSIRSFAQKEFSVRHYTSQNGLPQNSVKSMMMDHNGLLWIVTEFGIVRFDGNHFKVFNTSNCSAIIDNRLSGIFKMPDNTIAVNDECGSLMLIDDGRISLARKGDKHHYYYIPLKGGLPNTKMYEVVFRQRFPTDKKTLMLPWNTYPLFIYPVSQHSYWVRGKDRMLFYQNDVIQRDIPIDKGNLGKIFVIDEQIFFPDAKNEMYAIDKFSDILIKWKLTGDLLKNPGFKKPLISRNIFCKYGLQGAYIKIGSNLYTIERIEPSRELKTTLLCDQLPVNCMINDVFFHPYYKTLFIGTDTKGLFILKEKNITTLVQTTYEEGDNNAYYAQLTLDSNHTVTANNRIFGIDGVLNGNIFPPRITKEFLMRDKKGNLWFGYYDTVFCYNPVSRTKKFFAGKKGELVNILYEEGDSVWVGSSHGISYIKDEKRHRFFNFDGAGTNLIPKCIYRHTDGKLYFMSCSGAFLLNTKTHRVDTVDQLRNTCIRSVVPYKNMIFTGTYGQGFFVYANDKIYKMPLDKNGYLSEVHSFLFDKNNYVWMSTNNGLFKARIEDIEQYISDSTSVLYYSYYNMTDGIRNTEFNGGCFPSSIALDNGYFSFPTMEGMVWFDPLKVNDLPPNGPIIIDRIQADKLTIEPAGEITLMPGVENIDIYITAPYWGNEENLLVEYMLEGFNRRWIPLLSDESAVSFTTLPPGTYNLVIRKKAGHGVNNFVKASMIIHVPPMIYQTTLFILFCCGAFVLLFWIGIRLYVSNIRQRTISLENKVNERTVELITMNEQLMENYKRLRASEQQLRQSNDLKDQLVSIISHDILTPLKFISVVAKNFISARETHDGGKEIIRDIHHTSQRLYENSQNILNWIKYQNTAIVVNQESIAPYSIAEDLKDLLMDLSLMRKNTIVNEVEMDDIVKTDKTIFTIILQNILSNAVKYTHSSTIKISSFNTASGYIIEISDDGSGIGESNLKRIEAIRNKTRTDVFNHAAEGTGLGYIIVFDLAYLINASVEIKSTPDLGTTVIITLPV